MYHIKDDKRMKTSAELLVAALQKCLVTTKMSELTVSDLSNAANVSRSTFYRLFDTPVDVLMYACDTMAGKIVEDYMAADIKDQEEFVLFSLRYWHKHYEILEAMFNCGRLDLVHHAIEMHSSKLIPEIDNVFTPTEQEYLRIAAAGAFSGMLKAWIRNGKRETPEEMFLLYKKYIDFVMR